MFSFCSIYNAILLIFLGYLLGSIPFGLIIVRLAGLGDIRKSGSGNIGTTNVFRKSKLLGAFTLLFDMAKGVLAVYICKKLCDDYLLAILCGVSSVLGHIFPVWLKFKGGKGVATSLAVFTMTNWLVGLSAIFTWIIAFVITKISGAAAIISFALAPIITYFLTHDPRLILANTFICIIVIVKHKENIKKIMCNFYKA